MNSCRGVGNQYKMAVSWATLHITHQQVPEQHLIPTAKHIPRWKECVAFLCTWQEQPGVRQRAGSEPGWAGPGGRAWELYLQHAALEKLTALCASPTELCKQSACSLGTFLPYVFSTTTVRTPREGPGKFGCGILQRLCNLCLWNWKAPYPACQEQPRGLLEASLQHGPGKAPHFPFNSSNGSESATTACLPHAKLLFKHPCKADLTHVCKMRFWIYS